MYILRNCNHLKGMNSNLFKSRTLLHLISWNLLESLSIRNILGCYNCIVHRNSWSDPVYNKGNMQYRYVKKILSTDTNIFGHNKIHHLSIRILPDILCMDITPLSNRYKWFFSKYSRLFHTKQFYHTHLRIINSHLLFV